MRIKLLLVMLVIFSSMHAQDVAWTNNIEKAIEISNKTRKPMLILFTANNMDSDLQNDIFKTYDFSNWAEKKVILVKLDLSDSSLEQQQKDSNLKLKNAFGVQKLPTICFAKAAVRNTKTTFQYIGSVVYDHKGVRNWIDSSNSVMNQEE